MSGRAVQRQGNPVTKSTASRRRAHRRREVQNEEFIAFCHPLYLPGDTKPVLWQEAA